MPHLHAVHCRISSVVPVKLPVMRLRRLSEFVSIPIKGFQGCKFAICAVVGTWWFAVLLSRRGSNEDLVMYTAHVVSTGNALPGGRVASLFITGDVDIPVAFLFGETLGDATAVAGLRWACTENE